MSPETAPVHFVPPRYDGASLPNLVATLEERLVGESPYPVLSAEIASRIPHGKTYVLVVMDGLGAHQLNHSAAADVAAHSVATLDAPFPTTTTVSLACLATAQPPSQHGLLGYTMHLPDHDMVVNTIRWTTLRGQATDIATDDFLPGPNTWERIRAGGSEAITVQPGHFAGSGLSRLLYRGCRFEPAQSDQELIEATMQLAVEPDRLIVVYVPHVDFAAHVHGQDHPEYAAALRTVATIWSTLAARLPHTVTLLGTADHGHIDFPRNRQFRIDAADHKDRIFYGDGRAMMVKGDGAQLATRVPATWIPISEMVDLWGPGPRHPLFTDRAPDGVLFADDGWLLLHRHANDRLIGNHGGMTPEEVGVPLLVRPTT
ncbi:type I phosphodiesterase / nucleotide pyrophosphatase [bacterium BMS3Bbin02]|nr:type I phosphodiesterase / nucleotide pyrophosphatase [bacterium BMS3Bbin02]